MSYKVDFEKVYNTNDKYIEWIKVIVLFRDRFPEVYQIKKRTDGVYEYTHDEYWVASLRGPITRELSIGEMIYPEDIEELDAYWDHP